MENKQVSNGDKLKNAICYIPLGWVVLFFTEQTKSNVLMKHIKYWTALFLAFVILRFIIAWILMLPISGLLSLVYIWITWFFWYKAYNWEDINIEYIDDFEKKMKDKLNDNTSPDKKEETKKEVKEEQKKEDKKDDDVLDF